MPTDFAELLKRVAGRFPSQQALADAIGITAPRLNRAMKHGDYALNVANCLKLARISDEAPSEVLRAAGKADLAELIEALYGTTDETITPAEREHLRKWRGLSTKARRNLGSVIDDVLAAAEDRDPVSKKRNAAEYGRAPVSRGAL